MSTLGDLVYKERRRRGMTQREFSEASGLPLNSLNTIERGLNFYALDKLYQLALAFADGDREQAGVWLYRFITAMDYPLPAPAEG